MRGFLATMSVALVLFAYGLFTSWQIRREERKSGKSDEQ
jgi:hypothetical protein